jgi:SAM-dependent methyltransferase
MLHMSVLYSADYVRQRVKPKAGDYDYLHLSDLLLGIQSLILRRPSRVLDYGCGGSPYRSLFEPCTYHRADLIGGHNLDFEYDATARLPASIGGSYECVLSTQVLEHVQEPTTYLMECCRVLIPGGALLLTTHGLFGDHACPHDYWRWTTFGLQRLVEHCGFKVLKLTKLTTGPRGALFLSEREFQRLTFWNAGVYGHCLSWGVRVVQRLGARRMHNAADKCFLNNRLVDAGEPGHDIYVAIALLAHRLSSGGSANTFEGLGAKAL